MSSRNPALNDKIFQREIQANNQGAFTPGWGSPAQELPPGLFAPGQPGPGQVPPGAPTTGGPVDLGTADTMRLGGVVSATAILFAFLLVAGWFGWQAVTVTPGPIQPDGTVENAISVPPWIFISVLVGFGIAILTVFKPKVARFTAPLYAIAEGVFLGAISHAFDAQYEGIVVQAISLTIAVFGIMLVLFATGTIKVTEKLRMVIIASTMAIALVYLVSIVMSFFGTEVPMIHDSGPVGIGFSLVVVGVASFNLLLDFDFIQRGVAMRAPRYLEWYGAFGLMVTLVWLYIEILRLLAKLRER